MGRCEEAAMIEYMLACRKRQNDQKVQALKKSLVSGKYIEFYIKNIRRKIILNFLGFSVNALSNESKYVQEYIGLLEKTLNKN